MTRTVDNRIDARTKFLDAEGCLKVGEDSAPDGTFALLFGRLLFSGEESKL